MNKSVYNKPYIWIGPYTNSGYLRYDTAYRETDYCYFRYGRPIAEYPYDLKFECEVAEEKMIKYDVLNSIFDSPIVNQKVLNILMAICPEDFQAFPAIIRNAKPKAKTFENRDYFVLNITRTVKAIDKEKSIYTIDEDNNNRIDKIKKLVFKEDAMGSFHLARDKSWSFQELLSPTLVKAFKKEKIRGLNVYTDEKYELC